MSTTKKLLIQLDTDTIPSMFDTVVAYDGGADHVVRFGGIHPSNVTGIVEGAIFTRSPKKKQYTAIFIGGSSMEEGEQLFESVRSKFFAGFRVSVMLDSNGSNTTASAAVVRLTQSVPAAGKRAVVLAGTGPVGQRAALLLANEGASVSITSRRKEQNEKICRRLSERCGHEIAPVQAATHEERAQALEGAQLVLAAGAAGVELLGAEHWRDNPTIEAIADANATPPLGVAGTEMMDRGEQRHGKVIWGAIGFGDLKLQTHRRCIAMLFESHDQAFDIESIYQLTQQVGAG